MIIEKRIPLKYWFDIIKWDLLIVSVYSTVIYIFLGEILDFSIPLSIGVFLGTSITLLLSFKLSQSYDRWWEARKIWGAIVNDSRSFVVQLRSFTQLKDKAMIKKMAFRQIAWCYSLSQSLRRLNPNEYNKEFISEAEIDKLQNHNNVPLGIIDLHGQDLSVLRHKELISDFQYIQLDNTLVRLVESMGKAERIKNTYFPKTYRVTLQFFIYIFLTLLSLSFIDEPNYYDVPLIILISIPFFLLERIAFDIQDPFENIPTDTPMLSISRTIELNLKQLIEEEEVPKVKEPETFYVM